MLTAILQRDEKLLASLLSGGGGAKKELEVTDPKTGLTPLATAASIDNIDALHVLVEYGANVNGQSSTGQQTALHVAASKVVFLLFFRKKIILCSLV